MVLKTTGNLLSFLLGSSRRLVKPFVASSPCSGHLTDSLKPGLLVDHIADEHLLSHENRFVKLLGSH